MGLWLFFLCVEYLLLTFFDVCFIYILCEESFMDLMCGDPMRRRVQKYKWVFSRLIKSHYKIKSRFLRDLFIFDMIFVYI